MSIAEKLTAVAENQQKVYDAGFTAGKAIGGGTESLPAGYLKVDPTWTNFSYLCQNRPSIVASLKYSDTANGTTFVSTFQSCEVNSIPSLDLRKGTNFSGTFAYSSSIEEIGEIDISNATAVANMFLSTSGLKRITFVPGCIKLSLSFAQSKLLEDTAIQSIIDGLADLTGQTQQTLTLHNAVGSKLTDEQKATLTAKNWNLVY